MFFEGFYDAGAVFDLALGDHSGEGFGDGTGRLLFVLRQVGREGVGLAVGRIIRIVEIKLGINPGLPGVDAGPVRPVIVGL